MNDLFKISSKFLELINTLLDKRTVVFSGSEFTLQTKRSVNKEFYKNELMREEDPTIAAIRARGLKLLNMRDPKQRSGCNSFKTFLIQSCDDEHWLYECSCEQHTRS